MFIDSIEELKENYNSQLYDYFIEQFHKTLEIDKKREIYQRASKYIKAISKLNNGETLVNDIINKLNNSKYQKCYALYEEINQVLDKN